jgi:NADP-dependent 3-hydroxy acid dehydrogenase YdfG
MEKPLILITGASSGIGASIAKTFSETGFAVGLLARNLNAMKALNLPSSVCLETDVTDIDSVKKSVQEAEKIFGPTAGLINNAGFGKGGEFTSLEHADHAQMLQVNLQGVVNTIEAVLPGMQTRKFGTIINISSVADRNARPNLAVYAATKAAVKSLSESLRMANAKHGIRICNVAPAKIRTPLLISSGLDQNQIIEVEDVAKAVLWIFQQPRGVCIRDLVIAPTYYEA